MNGFFIWLFTTEVVLLRVSWKGFWIRISLWYLSMFNNANSSNQILLFILSGVFLYIHYGSGKGYTSCLMLLPHEWEVECGFNLIWSFLLSFFPFYHIAHLLDPTKKNIILHSTLHINLCNPRFWNRTWYYFVQFHTIS